MPFTVSMLDHDGMSELLSSVFAKVIAMLLLYHIIPSLFYLPNPLVAPVIITVFSNRIPSAGMTYNLLTFLVIKNSVIVM